MKNSWIWLLLLSFLGIGVFSFTKVQKNDDYSNNSSVRKSEVKSSTNNNSSIINELTYSELKGKIDNDDSFTLLIASSSCSHCVRYEPIVKEVLQKQKKSIYKVNINGWSDNEIDGLKEIFNYVGTPTIVVFKNGNVLTNLIGYREKDYFDTWAKTNIS